MAKKSNSHRERIVEEQIAELTAQVAALQGSAAKTNTMFAETYYYLTIPLMIIIHAGFLAYEMGASRAKNALSSGVKNILAFAFVIPAFYFFGWWVYWGLPTGFTGSAGPNGVFCGFSSCSGGRAWWREGVYLWVAAVLKKKKNTQYHNDRTPR